MILELAEKVRIENIVINYLTENEISSFCIAAGIARTILADDENESFFDFMIVIDEMINEGKLVSDGDFWKVSPGQKENEA